MNKKGKFIQSIQADPSVVSPAFYRNTDERRALSEAMTLSTSDGFYRPTPLFDLCVDDNLYSLVLLNKMNAFFNEIPFITTNLQRDHRAVLTYVGGAGTGASTYAHDDSLITDACAPNVGVESGTCEWLVTGFNRQRLSSDTRDITDQGMRYCATQPTYRIDGTLIEDDVEWDGVRLMTTILQDMQYLFFAGGTVDGLLQLVTAPYTDPNNDLCPAMDSYVVDWSEQVMCDTEEDLTGITLNGNPLTGTFDIVDIFDEYVEAVITRIDNSGYAGEPRFVFALPMKHLGCLIDCYVCHVDCARDITRLQEPDARASRKALRSQLRTGSVTLDFWGVPVTFYVNNSTALLADDGLATIVGGVTRIGNTPLIEIQMKTLEGVRKYGEGEFIPSDGGRILTWETLDHTCLRRHVEMQWRVALTAPWAWMQINDVTCTPLFGHFSEDTLSGFFYSGQPPVVTMPKS